MGFPKVRNFEKNERRRGMFDIFGYWLHQGTGIILEDGRRRKRRNEEEEEKEDEEVKHIRPEYRY